jgi:uncharacterized protein YbjQ (UPF0145 family)
MMAKVKSAKENILQVLGFIREVESGRASNDLIARLNQIAYQGARSNNLNKKIAERADKNMERFKDNDKKQ